MSDIVLTHTKGGVIYINRYDYRGKTWCNPLAFNVTHWMPMPSVEYVLSYDGWSSSCTYCKSIRALTRRITKWNLPVGTIIEVHGRYVGEEYEIVVKR